jgi:ATP-dependent Clp protease adaptor protein ClpS
MPEPQSNISVKPKPATQKPPMYKVLLLNDDYTPMEFVVQILQTFFNKNLEEATQIMMHVHMKGVGLCGVFTREVAETKVGQVLAAAKQAEHPLQCTMEKE